MAETKDACGCIPVKEEKKEMCDCGCIPMKVEEKNTCGCGCVPLEKEELQDKQLKRSLVFLKGVGINLIILIPFILLSVIILFGFYR